MTLLIMLLPQKGHRILAGRWQSALERKEISEAQAGPFSQHSDLATVTYTCETRRLD